MKKLAVIVLMASISLTACGNKAVKADSWESAEAHSTGKWQSMKRMR